MNILRDKLMEIGADKSNAEKISKISSRKEAIDELLKIAEVRLATGASKNEGWKIEKKMKELGIYYNFKG